MSYAAGHIVASSDVGLQDKNPNLALGIGFEMEVVAMRQKVLELSRLLHRGSLVNNLFCISGTVDMCV